MTKQVIIHCAATPNGKPISVERIDDMHRRRGFKRTKKNVAAFNSDLKHIGYNFYIDVDGSCHNGRGLNEVGAHVRGHNRGTVGVCMAGTDKFTDAQWMTLRNLAKALEYMYRNDVVFKGHRDYSPDLNGDGKITSNEFIKLCPGFDVSRWVDNGMVPFVAHIFK